MVVARAEGAQFDSALPSHVISHLAGQPGTPGGGNSTFYDRLAGRQLDYEARNGVIGIRFKRDAVLDSCFIARQTLELP